MGSLNSAHRKSWYSCLPNKWEHQESFPYRLHVAKFFLPSTSRPKHVHCRAWGNANQGTKKVIWRRRDPEFECEGRVHVYRVVKPKGTIASCRVISSNFPCFLDALQVLVDISKRGEEVNNNTNFGYLFLPSSTVCLAMSIRSSKAANGQTIPLRLLYSVL